MVKCDQCGKCCIIKEGEGLLGMEAAPGAALRRGPRSLVSGLFFFTGPGWFLPVSDP